MSAIFDFSSLLTVILLIICTCAYLRDMRPTIFDGGQVRGTEICVFSSFPLNISPISSSIDNATWGYETETNGGDWIFLENESDRRTIESVRRC